ncbi:hypothetical protein ACHAXT_000145 [Thalassiosira profunda]
MSTFHSLEPNPTLRGTDVTQLRKARRSVEAPDLRPVFGCAWCGPPQQRAEETLCPLCLPLQRKGWSRRVNAQAETKVFADERGTKFPSKRAFLEGSTSIVGERIKEMEEGERGALLGKLHAFEIEEEKEKEKETRLPRAPSERVKCDAGEDAPRLPQPQQPKISVSTDFKVGDRVRAFWVNDTPCSDARWCEGTIHSINGNGTYRVKFPDDSKSCPRVLIVTEGEFAPFTDAVLALRVGDRVHAPRWDSESGTSELASHPPTWLGAVITRSEGSGTRRAFRVRFDGDGKEIPGIKASLVFPWREGMPEEPLVGKEEGKKRSVGKMRGVKKEEKKPKRNKVCTNIEFGGSAESPGKRGLPKTAESGEVSAGHSLKRQKIQRFVVGEIPSDIYLSLKDDTYKSVMFSKFQEMEATTKKGYADMADKVLELLEARGAERFFRIQGKGMGAGAAYEVDRKSALAKINSDFSRRTESYPVWGADPEKKEAVVLHLREKRMRQQRGERTPRAILRDAGLPGLDDVDDEGYGYYCFVCQDGGDILCCENCTNVCHLGCHYPTLNEEPDNFLCIECANEEVYAFWQCDGRIACSLGVIVSISYRKQMGGKTTRFCGVKLLDSDEVVIAEDTFVIPKADYCPGRVYEEGDRVFAPWSRKNGDPKWYAGTVKSVLQEEETRQYSVKFDGGGKWWKQRVVDGDQLVPIVDSLADSAPRRSVHFDNSSGDGGGIEEGGGNAKVDAGSPAAAAASKPGPSVPTSAKGTPSTQATSNLNYSATKSEARPSSRCSFADAPLPGKLPSEININPQGAIKENVSEASMSSFNYRRSISLDYSNFTPDENDPLLVFLRSQSACIKGNVDEFFVWLVKSEDVDSMSALKEAVSDANYLETLKEGNGRCGVKGFKRAAFLRAVTEYEDVEPQKSSNDGSTSTNGLLDGAPQELVCPIGLVLMTKEPVLASDGMTYERANIDDWFKTKLSEIKAARENLKHNSSSKNDLKVVERGICSPVYGTEMKSISYTLNTNVRSLARSYEAAQRSTAASGTGEGQPKLERVTSL